MQAVCHNPPRRCNRRDHYAALRNRMNRSSCDEAREGVAISGCTIDGIPNRLRGEKQTVSDLRSVLRAVQTIHCGRCAAVAAARRLQPLLGAL
jgi:hypothetical protein